MQRSALCRSRRELSNEYLLANIGVDTAENEPLEVWGKIFSIIHWCPYCWCDLHKRTHPMVRTLRAVLERYEAAEAEAFQIT